MSVRLSAKLLLYAGSCTAFAWAGFIAGRHHTERPSMQPTLPQAAPRAPGNSSTTTFFTPAAPPTLPTPDLALRWESLKSLPLTPDSEERMRSTLQALGNADAASALKLAETAPTARLRENLRNAVLQGWAVNDPRAAGRWALENIPYNERRIAIEAIAAGASARPDEAVSAFRDIITGDPVLASDHGNALVSALVRTGRFEIAAEFADSGAAQYRATWLASVFHEWSVYQPQAALGALARITDPAAREQARDGLLAGWSGSDPGGLVAYAQTLPPGPERIEALNHALPQWVHKDPVAASAWMEKLDPGADLDAGAAAIAMTPALIEKKPEIAVSWAESIADPELRSSTLLELLRLWAESDSAGARRYVTTAPLVSSQTRDLVLATIDSAP